MAAPTRAGAAHLPLLRRLADVSAVPLIAFAIVFLAVRVPFLLGGYGADTDAYRVALSARYLWSAGEYLPSRLPGYPLHELTTALLIWGGAFLTNLATAVVAFVGVLIVDRIVVLLAVPGRGWLLVAMAFTPWLLVNSATTLDYHWSLTAMLGAYLAVIRRRPLLAGVLLGLAVGCRITAGAFLPPLVVVAVRQSGTDNHRRHGQLREALVFASATLVVAGLAYVPVLWTYGPRFWTYADSKVPADVAVQLVWQRALGAVGALVTVGVLMLSWRRLLRLPQLLRTDPHVLAWTLTVLIYVLLYLRLPVDAGYLVPVYPFAFLLVARVLARWALPVIVTAALLSGFVDLDVQRIEKLASPSALGEVRPSWRVATFAHDLRARRRWQAFAGRIVQEPVPPHSVVLTLGAFPVVTVDHWGQLRYAIVERDLDAVSMLSDNGALWDDANEVVYLAVSGPQILERFRAEGYQIYRAEPEGADWRVRLRRVE